jgi:hypothetical protein
MSSRQNVCQFNPRRKTRRHTVRAAFCFTSLEALIGHPEIRITEHTELGDNDTIKDPENMVEMPRRRRGKEEEVATVE